MLKNTLRKIYYCNNCLKHTKKTKLSTCMICYEYTTPPYTTVFCEDCYKTHLSKHSTKDLHISTKKDFNEIGNSSSIF